MNLALSSIVILLLLLPSLVFRFFLIQSDGLENPLDTSLKAEIGILFFLGILFNLVGVGIVKGLGFTVNIAVFYKLLIGTTTATDVTIISQDYWVFLLYILIFSTLTSLLAFSLKKVILNQYLDIKYAFLPVTNEWDQILSGRLFKYEQKTHIGKKLKYFKRKQKELKQVHNTTQNDAIAKLIAELEKEQKTEVSSAWIDALVKVDGSDYLYSGKLHKYYLETQNKLDKIVLKEAQKRRFIVDNTNTTQPEKLEAFKSDYFVIDYKNIKNLNITFLLTTGKE